MGEVTAVGENKGRHAKVWISANVSNTSLLCFFWHGEGWTARNEAVMHAANFG